MAQSHSQSTSALAAGTPPRLDYAFKGPGRRTAWFEGWYFKFTLDQTTTLSLIPSLHLKDGITYGYLQWIIAREHLIYSTGRMFPIDEVRWVERPFQLKLGNNSFSETGLSIHEPDLKMDVQFSRIRAYPGDIMGPFRHVQGIMPCSHGLVASRGRAAVSLDTELIRGDFSVRLYVEKDWGDTFPDRYIWIQADFPEDGSSFFFSIATVKVGALGFDGFIAHLILDGADYTFATWNLSQCRVQGSEEDLRISLANDRLKCLIRIQPQASVRLKSPIQGHMASSIRESLQAPLRLLVQMEDGSTRSFRSRRASMEYHEWFSR